MSYLVLFCSCVFSPFSIAVTLLGEERTNCSAFRTFVRFALVWFCLFPLPLGVWEGLRFVIVALPGLFSYLFFNSSVTVFKTPFPVGEQNFEILHKYNLHQNTIGGEVIVCKRNTNIVLQKENTKYESRILTKFLFSVLRMVQHFSSEYFSCLILTYTFLPCRKIGIICCPPTLVEGTIEMNSSVRPSENPSVRRHSEMSSL